MRVSHSLDEGALQDALPGWHVICLECTTSTNDEARRLAVAGAPDRTVILAEEQTAGRGRRGTPWISPLGRNGIVSVLSRPGRGLPPAKWARLTLAAALAGCDAMDAVPGLGAAAEVKWPNDLYLSGRKAAGILVESAWAAEGGFVVTGTGFNLNLKPEDFPSRLQETATSVWIERGGLAIDRTVFLVNYLRALESRQLQAQAGFTEMKEEAWRRSWLAGKQVALTSAGQAMEGTVCGLGPEGELLLRLKEGEVIPVASADLVRPMR